MEGISPFIVYTVESAQHPIYMCLTKKQGKDTGSHKPPDTLMFVARQNEQNGR